MQTTAPPPSPWKEKNWEFYKLENHFDILLNSKYLPRMHLSLRLCKPSLYYRRYYSSNEKNFLFYVCSLPLSVKLRLQFLKLFLHREVHWKNLSIQQPHMFCSPQIWSTEEVDISELHVEFFRNLFVCQELRMPDRWQNSNFCICKIKEMLLYIYIFIISFLSINTYSSWIITFWTPRSNAGNISPSNPYKFQSPNFTFRRFILTPLKNLKIYYNFKL